MHNHFKIDTSNSRQNINFDKSEKFWYESVSRIRCLTVYMKHETTKIYYPAYEADMCKRGGLPSLLGQTEARWTPAVQGLAQLVWM